jgi:hypothetical protein
MRHRMFHIQMVSLQYVIVCVSSTQPYARGLDTPSFGGLKRERDASKSPATMQQKQVTITVTSTSGDGNELKFICPICGKSSPSTEDLGKHMEMHSGYVAGLFEASRSRFSPPKDGVSNPLAFI